MTAEEAYKILTSEPSVTLIMFKGIMIGEALMMAIGALETIAQLEKRGITIDTINEYKTFEDECVSKGFTFKSLLEAREKMTAKKPISKAKFLGLKVGFCPSCGESGVNSEMRNCDKCGQAIDWSVE